MVSGHISFLAHSGYVILLEHQPPREHAQSGGLTRQQPHLSLHTPVGTYRGSGTIQHPKVGRICIRIGNLFGRDFVQ
jgi:hypothetical protein